jgi:hypothetical protein
VFGADCLKMSDAHSNVAQHELVASSKTHQAEPSDSAFCGSRQSATIRQPPNEPIKLTQLAPPRAYRHPVGLTIRLSHQAGR